MRARTTNGSLRGSVVRGELTLSNTNGRIIIDNIAGTVEAHTTNGKIALSLRETERTKSIHCKTTNGSIEVGLPKTTGAHVIARTSNGKVHTDIPVTVSGTLKKNRIDGEMNGGGFPITLVTTNGSIRIEGN